MSLRQMALQGRLPARQSMDRETVRWIEQEGIATLGKPAVALRTVDTLAANLSLAMPQGSFFIEEAMRTGIHGSRHCSRVGILAALVCGEIGVNDPRFIQEMVLAGSLHDCRRLNDHRDRGHGQRSAEWFRSHRAAVAKAAGIGVTDTQAATIYAAIKFHDLASPDIPSEVYAKHGQAIDIIKTADALDRYRLPLSRWWIDDDYLHIKPSLSLKQTAFWLMYLTEDAYLKTKDAPLALRAGLEKLKHV